jgi:NAD(P)-dependent dehydrogenase (short-subunit alcohol dehydrogenase family)
MRVTNKTIIVTGAASGIGRAMAQRFKQEGAKALILADMDRDGVKTVASELDALAVPTDVSDEAQIKALVATAEAAHGPVNVFCSNAGIIRMGDEDQSDDDILACFQINTMSHVYAARAVAPGMAARGSGYLVNTVSAAGLLIQVDSAAYTMSKHAALGLAEFLAAKYTPAGIRVSVVCPQGVRTAMTSGRGATPAAVDGMIEAEDVADAVIQGMDAEKFIILPHPTVADYMARKAGDRDRWLRGMARLRERLFAGEIKQ